MSYLCATRSKVLCILLLTLTVGRAASTEAVHLGLGAELQDSEFTAEKVWLPEVEQLQWSSVRPESPDRDWLQDGFMPGSHQVVVRGVANTSQSAIDKAVEQVLPRLNIRLQSKWKRYVTSRRVRRELKRSSLVEDRFAQAFLREAAGEQHEVFTREALLLDLSDENLREVRLAVARDLHRASQVRKTTFSITAIAVAVTCLLTWLGARFLNVVTQGYYVWSVRFASAAVLLVSFGLTAGFMVSMLRSM